jgi:hypothetical protein
MLGMPNHGRRAVHPCEMVVGFPSSLPMPGSSFGAGFGFPFPGLIDWQGTECRTCPQQTAANQFDVGNYRNYRSPIVGYSDRSYPPCNPPFNGPKLFPNNFTFSDPSLSGMCSALASNFLRGEHSGDSQRLSKHMIERIQCDDRKVMSVEGLLNPCPLVIGGGESKPSDSNEIHNKFLPNQPPAHATKDQSRFEKLESRKRPAEDHTSESNSDDLPSKRKWKVVLTPELAVTVFRLKPRGNAKKSSSINLSQRYELLVLPYSRAAAALPPPPPPNPQHRADR